MKDFQSAAGQDRTTVLRARLLLLAFGLFVFAFLLVTGNPHWFELRPASTAAIAISNAAEKDAATVEPDA